MTCTAVCCLLLAACCCVLPTKRVLLSAACYLLCAAFSPGALPPELGLMRNMTDFLLANNKLSGEQLLLLA
jgi:hypothetical protein